MVRGVSAEGKVWARTRCGCMYVWVYGNKAGRGGGMVAIAKRRWEVKKGGGGLEEVGGFVG